MKGHHKVLLVDDDPDVLMTMGDVLESRGYEVVTARDGEEALENLIEEKPDLMILDLLMPRMDGFEVFKTLQDPSWSDYSSMPIMILTAVSEGASRRRYQLETGRTIDAHDYLEKPVDILLFSDRVAKLLRSPE
jgi:two-component system alkaline phosphatase synthesis response regulator PhoP